MAISSAGVEAILAAEESSGGAVRISFNARYGPEMETLCALLRQKVIGRVVSADFCEFLDLVHGADYFRRWHRRKENSGGLLMHKASHHFDQLNWLIGADPTTVHCFGGLGFYGPVREGGGRCLTCPQKGDCEFYLDLASDPGLKALYLNAETEDSYFRDRCVFDGEIDIEDTVVANIRYSNGVLVNYSLNAFSPFEGQRIGFNGTKGRIELDLTWRRPIPVAGGAPDHGEEDTIPHVVHVVPSRGGAYQVPLERREGTHGGADSRIREHLFREDVPDPLGQRAGSRAGAMSTLVGAAGNLSILTGQAVRLSELLSNGEALCQIGAK